MNDQESGFINNVGFHEKVQIEFKYPFTLYKNIVYNINLPFLIHKIK